MKKNLTIGGREFSSRLFLGTGKFASHELMRAAISASEASIATVALKRVDISEVGKGEDIMDSLEPEKYMILPNTSGAMNADEAVRIARMGEAAGFGKFVKLEIHPDPNYLLPDPVETLKATEILANEGFFVMPYMNADAALAMRLQDAGASALMPLGSLIGSNRGLETRAQIALIIEMAKLPVVVDAGLGAPSHAAEAMEMGADAVMVNTAIASSNDPVGMARAFKLAVEAGRASFEISGRKILSQGSARANPTSPLTAFLDE